MLILQSLDMVLLPVIIYFNQVIDSKYQKSNKIEKQRETYYTVFFAYVLLIMMWIWMDSCCYHC